MPKSFHQTPGMHCSWQNSVKFRVSVFQFCRQCRFLQSAASISPVPILARCSLLLLLIQSAARSFGRVQASAATWPPTPASSTVAEPPVAANRGQPCRTAPSGTAHTTTSLRVAVPFPVCAAEPSSWSGTHTARSLPPTCPRGRSVEGLEYHPSQAKFSP